MNELCGLKGIKREFSIGRTPQQNGVAEKKNGTLIEEARTMLADSLLPTIFWAEAVNTACYVLNRVEHRLKLIWSTNLDIQKNHYPLDFRNRRGDEARIKNTWYNQGLGNECHRRTLKILLRL
ncbi:putative ribonuclease H-like domain-containing protein [Tanacetum coccineum]